MAKDRARSRPTSKDVAALAGVSQSTVSYVLTGKRPISAETRRRVEDAMRQLRFQPNAGARALRGRRTNVVALVVRLSEQTDVADTVPYIDTVVEEARRRDYDVVLVTGDEGADGLVRLAKRSICDAVVLMDIRGGDPRVETAAGLGLPVVLIGTPDDSHGLAWVDFDSRKAGELLARELVDTGHRNIVLVSEVTQQQEQGFHFVSAFHAGVAETVAQGGLSLDVVRPTRSAPMRFDVLPGDLFAKADDGGRLGVIARTPQAIGIVAEAATVRGLQVGRDVSLVGQCTDNVAESFRVPVTNVSPEPRDTSRSAMAVVFEQLADEEWQGDLAHVVRPRPVTRRASTVVHTVIEPPTS
ncbi:LacI family DNA-binding transcriptional regulator [Promicromonospora sp. NPDC057488]|uniref:LacI family DNA-binding transcriptional regulator n=1 Tax=Promicromonospora sp. NPDC057488 TaxID=3346147 RepID=UPI00366BF4BE